MEPRWYRGRVFDIAIVATFMSYSVAVGFRARRTASRDLDEYLLAGRSV